MDERQPINPKAIEDLVHKMIADGRPIEEQCTVEITPPHIVLNSNKRTAAATQNRYVLAAPITWTADHKDTTESHE